MIKEVIMAFRETIPRAKLIKKYLKKDKTNPSNIYRQVDDDIILHKGIPPYLKKGKD